MAAIWYNVRDTQHTCKLHNRGKDSRRFQHRNIWADISMTYYAYAEVMRWSHDSGP